MLVLELELMKASDPSHFAKFDMTHDYWQLLLHFASQEFYRFLLRMGSIHLVMRYKATQMQTVTSSRDLWFTCPWN